MIFQQLVNEDSGCLSYVIGCGVAGQAIVVDPGRDRVADYLRITRKKGLRVSHIVETHIHADHISGNRDLAAATGAPVLLHHRADAAFDHTRVHDGDEIAIGQVQVKVLHTPGHTPESIALLVTDRSRGDEPWFVLTGDTLFIGSVGRPDFGGAQAAEEMFESLQRVLLPLGDAVEIYPSHGAGSLCGRAMSAKSGSTIGFERRFNPALQARSKGQFVDYLMADTPPKPPSFETIVGKNRGVVARRSTAVEPRSAQEIADAVARGARVVDVRDPAAYGEGHVPGALNVWIESPQFADRVGWFVTPGQDLFLIGDEPADIDRAMRELTRVGVDDVVGFARDDMGEWARAGFPVRTVPQMTVRQLAEGLERGDDIAVIDVREPFEWREGHIEGALHLPMLDAVKRLAEIPRDRPKAVLCAGGLRSSLVISELERLGVEGCANVTGGMAAWTRAGHRVVREP